MCEPTCLFKMSHIFIGGSVSWLREFRLGCASLCTKYNGLDPRTAPWSGKTPAADTGSSTWYCQTTCIVSFWNTKNASTLKRLSSSSVFFFTRLSKNIDRKMRLQRAALLRCPNRHRNYYFQERKYSTNYIGHKIISLHIFQKVRKMREKYV